MAEKEQEKDFNILRDKQLTNFKLLFIMKMMRRFILILVIILLTQNLEANIDYTVKKGDNLWTISKKFKIPISEIKNLNKIKNEKLIREGKTLIIPDNKNKQRPNEKITSSKETKKIANKEIKKTDNKQTKNIKPLNKNFIHHKITKSDCLWKIAKKYNVSVKEIKIVNNLKTDLLKIGKILQIPVKTKQIITNKKLDNKKYVVDKKEQISYEKILDSNLEGISSDKKKLIILARQYLGVRYRWGGTTSRGFDCSGFVYAMFRKIGINLPHSSSAQFKIGKPIKLKDLKPGDRVYFHTYRRGASHAGIYIGNGFFIHASSTGGRVVKISSLYERYYSKRFLGGRR